jgi:hypothetical protein
MRGAAAFDSGSTPLLNNQFDTERMEFAADAFIDDHV